MSSTRSISAKQRKRAILLKSAIVLLVFAILGACGGSSNAASSSSIASASASSAASSASTSSAQPSTSTSKSTTSSTSKSTTSSTSKSTTHASAGHPINASQGAKLRALLKSFSTCARAHGVRLSSKKGPDAAVVKACRAQLKGAVQELRAAAPPPKAAAPSTPHTSTTVAPPRNRISPALKLALEKFSACMRENGVDLPPPDSTSGTLFETSHLNKDSPQFKAAETKCNSVLKGSF